MNRTILKHALKHYITGCLVYGVNIVLCIIMILYVNSLDKDVKGIAVMSKYYGFKWLAILMLPVFTFLMLFLLIITIRLVLDCISMKTIECKLYDVVETGEFLLFNKKIGIVCERSEWSIYSTRLPKVIKYLLFGTDLIHRVIKNKSYIRIKGYQSIDIKEKKAYRIIASRYSHCILDINNTTKR